MSWAFVERVTRIELALSAWEAERFRLKLTSGIDDHSPVLRHRHRRPPCHCQGGLPRVHHHDARLRDTRRSLVGQRQAVHRPVRQAAPGRGVVRADLPPQRHPPAADQALFADHDREGRWHQTLQVEFLNDAGPFATIEEAQAAVNGWREE
jgi:hypothetical protein